MVDKLFGVYAVLIQSYVYSSIPLYSKRVHFPPNIYLLILDFNRNAYELKVIHRTTGNS